jgi:hypothetical protein
MNIDPRDNKYITLKEAAKLSGYAPDYLGQLIRKGKLHGKRVFLNEAWVTTETDLQDYLRKSGGSELKKKTLKERVVVKARELRNAHLSPAALVRWARRLILAVFLLTLLFILLLVWVFVSNIERRSTVSLQTALPASATR